MNPKIKLATESGFTTFYGQAILVVVHKEDDTDTYLAGEITMEAACMAIYSTIDTCARELKCSVWDILTPVLQTLVDIDEGELTLEETYVQ